VELFTIDCTTCQQRLKVRDESAIGEIQICPKCGSMVLIEAPPGWQGAPDTEPPPQAVSPAEPPPVIESQEPSAPPGPPANKVPSPPPRVEPPVGAAPSEDITEAAPPPTSLDEVHPSGAEQAQPSIAHQDVEEVPESASPDEPPAPGDGSLADVDEPPAGAQEPVLPTDDWTSQAAQHRQQWLMMGGAAFAGIVLAVGLFGFWVSRTSDSQPGEKIERPGPVDDGSEKPTEPPADEIPDDSKAEVVAADNEPPQAVENDRETPKPPTTDTVLPTAEPKPAETEETTKPATEPDETMDVPAKTEKPDEMILVPADTETGNESAEAVALSETLDALAPLIDSEPYATSETTSDANGKKPPKLRPVDLVLDAVSAPRPKPRQIDVPERLKDKIPDIEFPEVPLVDFVRFVTSFSTIPITLDPQALALVKVTPRTPVNVRLSDTNVGAVLSAALTPLRLGYVSSGSQLRITRPPLPDGGLREHSHPVADLVGSDPDQLSELADMIVEMIEPDFWDKSGGPGAIRHEKPSLEFRQRDTVIFQAIVFCEKLRTARGLPPQSNFDPALFNLEPRLSQAEKRLATPATINYVQPTLLVRILDRLSAETKLNILVDWQAIAELGWSPDGEATVSANNEPMGEVLTKILRPMDLTYRVIDNATVQVTSPTQLAARLDVELYPVADLLTPEQDAEEVIRRVRGELGDVGAVLHFDASSKHLIAALPQPQQRELADLLSQWRTKKTETE